MKLYGFRSVQKLDKEHIFNCKLKASFYHSSKIAVDESENYRYKQCGCACNTVTTCNTATAIQNKTLSANNLKSTDSNCVNCCGKPLTKPYVKVNDKTLNKYMNLLNTNDEKIDIRTVAQRNGRQHNSSPPNVADNNILQSSILSLTKKYVNYENGVDLFITNLDESKCAKELKIDLGSVIRAHCKVNHVNLVVDEGKNIHAVVNVPTLQDAHLCIHKLNHQTFFDSKINVSLSTPRSHDQLVQLKCDVAGMLLDVKTGWLPLLDFIATYKQRYKRTYNVTDFQRAKDIVYVDGLPGRQFVCLLQFPVDLLKVANNRKVEDEVLHVLSTHNRRIPLAR